MTAVQDAALNVLIRVPASKRRKQEPAVILQSHMDMVCEKLPSVTHDFGKDPIRTIRDGEWLRADGTTLGADNGIGMALALAIADTRDLSHPPLELLFTSDEETGLNGAKSVSGDFLSGRALINLDSEEEGVFIIGCAGGRDTELSLPLETAALTPGDIAYTISVDGLRGGHSGVDIHKQRENATIVLARVLDMATKEITGVRLAAISGGSAHNAIPRNARAIIQVPSKQSSAFRTTVEKAASDYADRTASYEPQLSISITDIPPQSPVYTTGSTRAVIDLLLALPHGVAKMSAAMEGLVETSNNLATLSLKNDTLFILSSQRSSKTDQLDWILSTVEAIAQKAGASYATNEGYPGWEPNVNSPLLRTCGKIYSDLFGKGPRIEIIHAGLECGIIGAKFGNMDMISLGPTVKNPHSPDERLYLPSVPKVWDLLVEILKNAK
jgi:dipeptidase D